MLRASSFFRHSGFVIRHSSLALLLLAAGLLPAAPPRPKPPAAGVFCLLEADRADRPVRGLDRRKCWHNPNVAGITLRTMWDKLEPARGRFDWTHFDQGLALARQHRKRLGLSVAAGVATPAWVYDAGAARFPFHLTTNFAPAAERSMPLPWDPAFLDQWDAFVRALGRRYDAAPEVAYVVVGGLGFLVETYVVKAEPDVRRFRERGGTARWAEAARHVLDRYAEAFPTTPFVLALAPPVPGPDGEAALRQVVAYGRSRYPGRFGVMHHGLHAQVSPRYYPNEAVRSLAAETTTGFQMVWSTRGPNARLLKGTLRQALDRAVELKAQFVEVYEADCADPAYADDLRHANERLRAGR